MSGIFQQVMHELGIKQYRSSAYHPESQGALERFHQTLKNMIRSYCFDTEKDWDEGIHLLLFAVRESVQESLGFSPFELVFGHSVRGPLKLLKEKFLSNDETPLKLLQYVSDFRNRLSRACEVARSNLKTSQGKMKARYDNHVTDRKFKLVDKVLALLPIKILRDTGASQSLILADILPFSEKTSSGTSVLIQGVECGTVNIPLHHVNLSSDLVTGLVVIGITPSLPFKGVHLLLGNDLAGDKVVVNPLVTDTPNIGQTDDPIEQEIPDLCPSCAVTRAMAKKAILKDSNFDIDLTDTFIGQYFNNEIKKSLDPSLSDTQTDSSMSCHSAPRSIDQGHDTLSKLQLIQEQQTDPEISKFIFRALPEDEISQVPMCYYIKNGILMRKWRPFDVPADDEWAVYHQIVIPKSYHHEILSIAHESPMSGHLGINKTYHKIINHFYWPGLKSDVSKYCKTCHTCQIVGKPNQTIPKAQLQPIPTFDEPFSRILIDCVGPLPRTKSGNEYLLTIMCTSTRFPEAIPLRNIKTKSIVKALIKFFTFVGLPKSVQSDQGSNFMSGIFQQVMHELGIKQYRSSACHPESQGALERFHQTLKNMIRSYCFDTEKDWDEGIHLLLFAVRESVQESLGFSPFELVFGHSVRGPSKLLKEKFL